ncbi:MAG: hypothetical protein WCY92_12700 [Novosphingobium sp.]
MIASWPCPTPGGETQAELAIRFDRKRPKRLLVLPALFDEGNKLRKQTVEVMRRLAHSGIDCFLPDLPGFNESLQPLEAQSLETLRQAATEAARHFSATHVLTIRAGAILAPQDLPGWRYAGTGGANVLRAMMRARIVASREAGRDEQTSSLAELGRRDGLDLAGYRIGPQLFAQLETSHLPDTGRLSDVDQETVGGSGLWLRAEPSESAGQADALAAIIAMGLLA